MSASLAPECNEVKEYELFPTDCVHFTDRIFRRYDSCFLKWYSESGPPARLPGLLHANRLAEFLPGKATKDECEPLFSKYRQCLLKALKERGIDDMLAAAREDNRENDAENMRPSCKNRTYTNIARRGIFSQAFRNHNSHQSLGIFCK